MKQKEKRIIFGLFMTVYIIFSIRTLLISSQWLYDHLLSIVALIAMYYLNRWLKLQKTGFTLFNIALLAHNLGAFGFYSKTWLMFGYDNIVHFTSSFVAAYILFNFVARKLHIRKNERVRYSVIDEHMTITIFLVFASVAMLGTIVEIVEFAGFWFLGPGDGIFFTGAGDGGSGSSDYIDTMTDIIVNTFGCFFGVISYYYIKYKKRPWLHR